MRIAVAAASGRTGRAVVAAALAHHHDVVALARRSSLVPAGLPVMEVDLVDPAVPVADFLVDADAVLSCLGPNRSGDAGTIHLATRHLIEATRSAGVRRFVAVSAAPVAAMINAGPTGDDMITRVVLAPLLRRLLRSAYQDLAAMEGELSRSGLDWTIVRPPRLTSGTDAEMPRTALDANVHSGWSVSRNQLATAMLSLIDDPASIGRAVGVAS